MVSGRARPATTHQGHELLERADVPTTATGDEQRRNPGAPGGLEVLLGGISYVQRALRRALCPGERRVEDRWVRLSPARRRRGDDRVDGAAEPAPLEDLFKGAIPVRDTDQPKPRVAQGRQGRQRVGKRSEADRCHQSLDVDGPAEL